MTSKSMKVLIGNANLRMSMASLIADADARSQVVVSGSGQMPPGFGLSHPIDPIYRDPLHRPRQRKGESPAQKLMEQQRRQNLAIQAAKKAQKKS